ncbi:MAG: DR2241 family protein [Halolamina sp.]
MNAQQFDDLLAAAEDGVSFDGLHVAQTADGYDFETPETSATSRSESELHDLAAGSPYVTNWHFFERGPTGSPDAARYDYLRWLEDADDRDVPERYEQFRDGGLTTEWGELAVTVALNDDGHRRYELRHHEDDDADPANLTDHDDPLAARDLVKFDDGGDYRPLKTAPTLPCGWRFAGLDAREVIETVDQIYPATVPNWHREREGELDVDHWTETMERQSGIYGVIRTWDRGEGYEHVNWVAEACCADSQCLKRREWEYDEDTDLDVDGGDGAFPCREPCSLVVAAARKWTKLEGERSRTYEFELTPSEKEQVEDIIGAVSDGEVEDVREADIYDGANRYRARFLRAKRFDEDGNLSGTPTEPDSEPSADAEAEAEADAE